MAKLCDATMTCGPPDTHTCYLNAGHEGPHECGFEDEEEQI